MRYIDMEADNVIVIGAGFAGIAAATCLAHEGLKVKVLEKNSQAGGRARAFFHEGFTFDMGPSWYWMPDVFEAYFARFGKKPDDYYDLVRLDPSYSVIFGKDDSLALSASLEALKAQFEEIEKGSAAKLSAFLAQAQKKYEIGMKQWVFKPGQSVREFMHLSVLRDLFKLDLLTSMKSHVGQHFSNEKLIRIMEFPVLFLGQTAEKIPALYSLMNYADMVLGTWYPMGGMYKIIEGMMALAREKGVEFEFDTEVSEILVEDRRAKAVMTKNGKAYDADFVVAGADYHHVDTKLLPPAYRNYSDSYWDDRTLAPSSLLFYLGVNKKLKGLKHHNLFFDAPLEPHAEAIYGKASWPENPLFYVCCPSVTDKSVAPEGHENLFILIPLAPGLHDPDEKREAYYHKIMERLETITGQSIREHVVYKRSYAHRDFMADYHAFKGNAYGLANTLEQTAVLKPKLKSKKLDNLYYAGQLTVPGPGVPPSLISGQIVAKEVIQQVDLQPSQTQ